MAENLKIHCPNCNKITNTGISMDENSFKNSTLNNNSTNCDTCGEIVNWNKEDVKNFN
ncbi:MAG: hypothetical protein K9K76_04580 [Halanaerobiales bacterium]|nr:hypothetical protein [Halanaerobiales bacterium]